MIRDQPQQKPNSVDCKVKRLQYYYYKGTCCCTVLIRLNDKMQLLTVAECAMMKMPLHFV